MHGELRRCGIGLHHDGPGQGVTLDEGMTGRLVRASGADRPHRRGGVESLEPFRPRPLSSSRAENFPNSNGIQMADIPSRAVGRANAGFVLLHNQMPGIISGADGEDNKVVHETIKLDTWRLGGDAFRVDLYRE